MLWGLLKWSHCTVENVKLNKRKETFLIWKKYFEILKNICPNTNWMTVKISFHSELSYRFDLRAVKSWNLFRSSLSVYKLGLPYLYYLMVYQSSEYPVLKESLSNVQNHPQQKSPNLSLDSQSFFLLSLNQHPWQNLEFKFNRNYKIFRKLCRLQMQLSHWEWDSMIAISSKMVVVTRTRMSVRDSVRSSPIVYNI